jgi:GTPase SAR1 family protein
MSFPIEIRKEHFKTHIPGLDELLRGGFVLPPHYKEDDKVNGLVILLKGKPGTGKTTLAQQLIYHLTKETKTQISKYLSDQDIKGEKTISFDNDCYPSQYFSIEQSQEELEDKILDMIISRIFEDMRDFFAGEELMNLDFFETEKNHIWHGIEILKELFLEIPSIISTVEKANLFNHLKIHYYDLKFFFTYFQYDSLKNAIVASNYFIIKNKDYNIFEGLIEALRLIKEIPSDVPYQGNIEKHRILFNGNKIVTVFDFLSNFTKEVDVHLRYKYSTVDKSLVYKDFIDFRTEYLRSFKEKKDSYFEELNDLFKEPDLSKLFKPVYNRREINKSLKLKDLDRDAMLKFEKRIKGFFAPQLNYKWKRNDFRILLDKLLKDKTINEQNLTSIHFELNSNQKGREERARLVKLINEEFSSFTNKFYLSHLPPEFNLVVRTSDSIHPIADSPYNFMLAQKIHDFINDVEDKKEKGRKIYPCIVLDGLNILSEKEKKLISIGKVIKTLKDNALFSIIIYDGEVDGSIYQDYFADMVIDMKGEVEVKSNDYFLHQIQIDKSRFQQAVLGWHQYKIRDFGLQVFPSVHFRIHINNYQTDQVIESFTPAFNQRKLVDYLTEKKYEGKNKFESSVEKILIDPEPGSFTAIFGARATFKTALILKFLYNSNQKIKDRTPGDALLLSLVDNLGTLKDTCFCPMAKTGYTSDCEKCHKNFYLFHQRSGCVASHEFFYNLDKRISEHESKTSRKITRLAFWDLTQLEYRFPLLSADPMFLPGLVEYAKKNEIAIIVMGAGNSKLTPAASAIADNVLFCWRSKVTSDELKVNTFNENSKEKIATKKEVLCVYVDRCQGQLGNDEKELAFIPIEGDKGIELKCPKSVFNEKKKEYGSIGFFKTTDYDLIVDSQQSIDTIIDMQGMGAVNRQSSDRVLERLADTILKKSQA